MIFHKDNYVPQLDETDCGAAVLSMILKHYDSDVSIAEIRNFSQTDEKGTTALGLVKAAEHFKLKTTAIRADMTLFENGAKDLQLPFIAHLDKNNGTLHYVLVTEVKKNYIKIFDPDPTVKICKVSYDKFQEDWTGIALFMAPIPEYHPVKNDKDSLWGASTLLLKQKSLIFEIVLATFICTLITIFGAFFLQNLIDTYVPDKTVNTLNAVSLGLAIAYIFHGIFTYVQGYLATVLGQRLSIDILLAYIKHLFEVPMGFFGTRKIGELTSRLTDANNIIETLSETAISTLLNVGTILFVSVALSLISIKLFLISLVTIPVYGLIIVAFLKKFDKINNERMEQGALLSSSVIESLRGIESIKALGIEDKMYRRIDHRFVKELKANYKYSITASVQGALKDTAQLIITLIILFVGSIMAMKSIISIGQLIAFDSLLGYLMGPIEDIIGLQSDLQTAKVANKRLNQILLIPSEKEDEMSKITLKNEPIERISFDDVNFEYKYGQPVLNDISLDIKANEKIAIVGLSGSGKTTLAKMMVGFYRANSGKIYINGHDINSVDRADLRDEISYLPQTPYIFSDSVKNNILLGTNLSNVELNDVIKATKVACIHEDIESLPDGYDSMLSEDAGLSGGQMQRIAIARTVLKGSSVMIFDESTSNLDLLTEKKVVKNLLELPKQTIIFIAHRLEVARKADRILVMDHGRVVEHGNHKQLIAKKGRYYDLWEG